jgi:hypothetical protein
MKTNKMLSGIRRNVSLILFVFFITSSGIAFAQHDGTGKGGGTGGGTGGGYGNATPEERASRLTSMMKEQLKLTAAQEPKVSAINLKYAKKNQELKAVADTAQRRKTATAIETARDGELKAVFTASQYKDYLKLKEEMKARRKR